jgi:hypothetical protein
MDEFPVPEGPAGRLTPGFRCRARQEQPERDDHSTIVGPSYLSK